MKTLLTCFLILSVALAAPGQLSKRKTSLLAPEPGTLDVEDMLEKPVMMKVLQETPVYTRSTMEQAIGSMAPGTMVKLVGLSDTGFRVRGRARHGDVAGWVKQSDLLSPDPNLVPNIRKLHERQTQVAALIEAKQIALGMTSEEVRESLGKPNRKSSKLDAGGKAETLEYVVYDKIPQYTTGVDGFGRPVQLVTYIKVETGSMSVKLKDNVVESIEETKGNPLGSGGVKIVPGPIFFGW